MSQILSALFSESGLKARHDDDLTDRLVSRYSASIFIALCVIVTTSTYVGTPINCWCPAQFTGTHSSYANSKCLISPTYSQNFDEALPQDATKEKHINYYVWVPFILICQACLCVLPSVLWKSCYKGVGFNVPSIIDRLESSQNLGWENKENAIKYVVQTLTRYAENYRRIALKGPDRTWCLSKSSGNYLTMCYLIVKLVYVIVIIGQFVLLNLFLGMDYTYFGLDMLHRISSGGDNWSEMNRFPKVTICEFQIRHMHRTQPYVLQCVLPINLFNEKIFLFIWFWLAILSVCTVFSFLKWSVKSLLWSPQEKHVQKQLRFKADNRPKDLKRKLKEFISKTVRRDTMFLLRMVSHNVGPLTEAEVIRGLWKSYYDETEPLPPPSCPPEPYNGDEHFPSTLKEIITQADRMHWFPFKTVKPELRLKYDLCKRTHH